MTEEELIKKGLIPNNVDCYFLYDNGFEYEIDGKYTLKLLDGTILCDDVDDCFLHRNGFEYKINGKWFKKEFRECVTSKESLTNDDIINFLNQNNTLSAYQIEDFLETLQDKGMLNEKGLVFRNKFWELLIKERK